MRLFLFASIVLLIGCTQNVSNSNKFLSQSDTLIIKTVKHKGLGLFQNGAGLITFLDTSEWKKRLEPINRYPNYTIQYPDNGKNWKLNFFSYMFDSLRYYDEETGKELLQQNLSLADKSLIMIKGSLNNKEVLILDENNNKDFRDDSIRTIKKWDEITDEDLIKCKYKINRGIDVLVDSGYIKIGILNGMLLESAAQHLTANFSIDNNNYVIGVDGEYASSFGFYRPRMYLFSEQGVKRDTFLLRDIVKLGEYIKLGKHHYKFHKLYNGCGTIVLTKEDGFNKLIGTQVGMKFSRFKCLTINGDTLTSSELIKDKPLLIANVSSCTPRYYNLFKNMNKYCKKSLNIIALDVGVTKDLNAITIDVDEDFNKDVYNKYRKKYSTYDCYLINKSGRIIDKFDIYYWDKNLTQFKDIN